MAAAKLLDDIRVIDLSQYIPGPLATRQMADLGADVIKIEAPAGDPMRGFMASAGEQASAVYRHLNRGKKICRLDLKNESDRQQLERLLADADILLESFRPGVLARLGFDADRLEAINPRLIHCALSGYGQNGPYALRPGHDINYCALSAQSAVSGTRERPVIGYPPIADHAAAMQASITMLAALNARDRQSGVMHLDVSISESILAWQYLPMLAHASERADSILNGGAAFYNIYQCADDLFISLGAIEPVFWENFCLALERPQWIARQEDAMPQRELIDEVSVTIAAQPRSHWQALLDSVDCCFEALFTAEDLWQQSQFSARHAIGENGPNYPAWIDHAPLSIATEPREFESADKLDWNKR